MSKITLKISIEDTRHSYKESFESSATTGALLDSIQARSGKVSVLLFSGFPPVQIAFSSREQTLSSVGVASGSVITVRERPVIVRRVVDADNSCLFHALSYAMTKDRNRNTTCYREAVSEAIARDPERYNEALLGRPSEEYSNWIKQSTSWGGEIERKPFRAQC